jgi:hypothetical protein
MKMYKAEVKSPEDVRNWIRTQLKKSYYKGYCAGLLAAQPKRFDLSSDEKSALECLRRHTYLSQREQALLDKLKEIVNG